MSLSKFAEPHKPWAVSEFQQYRPYITNFVDTNVVPLLENPENEIRRLCIHGEVKSGKREIVEYIAKRDEGSVQRVHIFVSAFHRKADVTQRIELSQHNMKVCSIQKKEHALAANEMIRKYLREGKKIIIHVDECDYGTSHKQNLKIIYEQFKGYDSVITILYSATPEELLFSQDITQSQEDDNFISEIYETGIRIYYIPPETYCGAKKFVEEGLVVDARPFFIKNADQTLELSSQGSEIITEAKKNIELSNDEKSEARYFYLKALREGNQSEATKYENLANKKIKNVVVLRLTYDAFGAKAIGLFVKNKHLFPELENTIVIVDKTDYKEIDISQSGIICETVQWSSKQYWDQKVNDKLIVIVHEQTSTRSTEWAFHDRVFATHDYRPNISYGTIAQAQLRVAHYSPKYGEFQRIRVYGHLKTFLFAAKMIDVADYLNDVWKKVLIKRTSFEVDEKVKFKKPEGGDWCDGKIISFANNSYTLEYMEEGHRYDVYNICKSNIKSNKEYNKYHIKNTNDNIIHHFYNQEYDLDSANKILEELGCNIKTEISSRVKGKSKNVLKIKSVFIECDENNIQEKLIENVRNNEGLPESVRNHRFNVNSYFNNFIINENGWKIYHGLLRSIRAKYTYEFMQEQRWGFNDTDPKPRLTVCYDGDKLGVCLRYTTGEKEEVTTLSAYLSMYQTL
jgi:hypothetical protein